MSMKYGSLSSIEQREEAQEYLEVVNQQGEVLGVALRSVCHQNPSLIHRVAHVLVFNPAGQILLQKRSLRKDVQPGKWDTSVGGHLGVGETFEAAAYREMKEELSIQDVSIHCLYQYIWKTTIETELVRSFYCFYAASEILYNRDEIDEVRFWDVTDIIDIVSQSDAHLFTPNLKEELHRYLDWKKLNNR